MSKLITLIVPFFQNINSISATLESIANSIKHVDADAIEVLFVNNNSFDGTEHFVKEYLGLIPGSLLICEKKQGVSHARNAGVLASSGEYIAFLDADDTLEESYFSDITYGISLNPDIVFIRHDNFSGSQAYKMLPVNAILLNHLKGWWNWQFVFKKSLAVGLKFQGACFEDFGFFPHIVVRSQHCILLERGLYRYNDNPASVTKRSIEWRISELQARFDELSLSSNEIGSDIFKRISRDFYEHLSLLQAIAGHFPVLGITETLALLKLSHSWHARLTCAKRLLRLNISSLWRPVKGLMMRASN